MPRPAGVTAVLTLLVLLAFAIAGADGHDAFILTGGSMGPSLPGGSLVIVKAIPPAALTVGDVVTFENRGRTITHRIAGIADGPDTRLFTTKGDANEAVDPERIVFDGDAGLVLGHIPVAGHLIATVQVHTQVALALLALGAACVWLLDRRMRSAVRRA